MSSTNDGDYKGPCSGEISLRRNQWLDTHSDGGVALLNTRCVWFGSYLQTVIYLFIFREPCGSDVLAHGLNAGEADFKQGEFSWC